MLGNIERLKEKQKAGKLSLDEQRELAQSENVVALTQVANLEAEQQALRKLPQPRELDPAKAEALEKAREVLKRPWPGGEDTPADAVGAGASSQTSGSGGQPPAGAGIGQPLPVSTTGQPTSRVPTPEEVGGAQKAIDKLKAQDRPLSQEEQRQLDAAEKTVARKTEANLLAQKTAVEKTGKSLHPTAAKALADAQAVLARPVPGEVNGPPGKDGGTATAPQAQNSTDGPRLQFSQGGANPKPIADGDIVDAHRILAQEEDAFQLGKSKPDTSDKPLTGSLKELAKAYSQKGKELRVTQFGAIKPGSGTSWYQVSTPNGDAYFHVDSEAKSLTLDTATLDSESTKGGGGSNIYQLAQTFAKQNGLTFLPDKTVSPKAQRRRISQMISSAFRHDTTDHLNGNDTFKDAASDTIRTEVPGWKRGDHDHNTALLLRMELDHTMDQAAQVAKASGDNDLVEHINQLTHDPKTNTIIDGRTGTALTQGALQSLVERLDPGESGVGATTLLRSIVTRSALQRFDASGRIRPLRETEGGHPGGQEPGVSDGDLVLVARGLYYSRPSGSAGGIPSRRMGGALSGRPGGLASAVAGVSEHLKTQVPGLLNDRTHVFHSTEDFLNSDYAKEHPLSKADLDKLHTAEGFHDPKTGHSVVIAGNVGLRPGETPHDALTRVILHERVGHDGLQALLGSKDSKAHKHWEGLTQRIKPEELDAIAKQDGYQHLAGDRNALAHEWFARQAEKSPQLLKKPGLLRDMWEAFKGQLRKLSNNWKDTPDSHLDTHLSELLRLSRKAALRPQASRAVGAPDNSATGRAI